MYFITTIMKPDKLGDFGTRCVGYFSNAVEALKVVKKNMCDLYEAGYYPYAVIEHIQEGLYQYDYKPMWFKYNEELNEYEEISQPEFAKGSGGYAIG